MLYRFKALAKRRDPDQLDVPLALASPRGWVVTLVIGFCMLALIGWGFLGRVPQHVTVTGRLQYPGGLVTMQSDARGTVKKLTELGVTLDQGDALAYLQRGAGEDDARISGVTGGRVIQILVSVGDVVDAGTPISVVEPGATKGAGLRLGGDGPLADPLSQSWSGRETDGVGHTLGAVRGVAWAGGIIGAFPGGYRWYTGGPHAGCDSLGACRHSEWLRLDIA